MEPARSRGAQLSWDPGEPVRADWTVDERTGLLLARRVVVEQELARIESQVAALSDFGAERGSGSATPTATMPELVRDEARLTAELEAIERDLHTLDVDLALLDEPRAGTGGARGRKRTRKPRAGGAQPSEGQAGSTSTAQEPAELSAPGIAQVPPAARRAVLRHAAEQAVTSLGAEVTSLTEPEELEGFAVSVAERLEAAESALGHRLSEAELASVARILVGNGIDFEESQDQFVSVLHSLLDHPDVMEPVSRIVSSLPLLMEHSDLVRLMHEHPQLLDQLTLPGGKHTLATLSAASAEESSGAVAEGLRHLFSEDSRARLAALAAAPGRLAVMFESIGLFGDLGGDWGLLDEVRTHQALFRAATASRNFTIALRENPAALGRLWLSRSLLLGIRQVVQLREEDVDVDDLRKLLEDQERLLALERHPREIWTLVAVPGMIQRYLGFPEPEAFFELLSGSAPLAQVLPDLLHLGRALANRPALLRAAFENPMVGPLLSAEPEQAEVWAELEDEEELEQELRTAKAPEPPEHEPHAEAPAVGQLHAHPVLQYVLQDPEFASRITEPLSEVLQAHPNLLAHPHEFRHLLEYWPDLVTVLLDAHAAGAAPTAGAVLFEPGVLRAVLAQQLLADEFGEPGQDAVLANLATVLAADAEEQRDGQADGPELVGLIRDIAPLADLVRTAPELVVRLWRVPGVRESLAGDERVIGAVALAPAVLNLFEDGDIDLAEARAGNGAFLRLVAGSPRLVQALSGYPDRIRTLLSRPNLLGLLQFQSAEQLSTGHWIRLLDHPELTAVLDRPDNSALARGLLAFPALFRGALSRPDTISSIIANPADSDDLPLMDAVWSRSADLDWDGGPLLVQSPVLREVVGGVLALPPAEQVRAAADRDGLMRYVVSVPVEPGGRDELRERLQAVLQAFIKTPELRRWYADHPRLADLLMHNQELLPTVLRYPQLVPWLLLRGEVTTLLLNEPAITRHLRVDGEFGLEFLNSDELRQMLGDSPALARQVAAHPALGRALADRRFRAAYTNEPLLRRLFRAVPDVLASVADQPHVLEQLRGARGLLAQVGARVALPGAAGRALTAALFTHSGLRALLVGRPELVGGFAGFPGVLGALAEVGAVPWSPPVAEAMARLELSAVLEEHADTARFFLRDAERLDIAARTPGIVAAAAAHSAVTRLLGDETARGLMLRQPELAVGVGENPGLAQLLRRRPALLGELARDQAVTSLLSGRPGLVAALQRAPALVHELLKDTVVWRAVSRVPGLAEAIVEGQNQRVEVLGRYPGASAAFERAAVAGPGVSVVDPVLLGRLVDSAAAMHLLNGHRVLAERVLRDARLAGLLVEEGFAEELARLADTDARVLEVSAEGLAARVVPRRDKPGAGTAGVLAAGAAEDAPSGPAREAAGARGRGPVLRSLQGVLPALAHAVEAMPGLVELVEGPLAQTVAEHPDLAVLLVWQHGLAEELAQDPEQVEGYRLTPFLAERPLLSHAGDDVAAFFAERGLALEGTVWQWYVSVAEQLREQVLRQRQHAEVQAVREAEARLRAFDPLRPDQWVYSGEVIRAGPFLRHTFEGDVERVLQARANHTSGPREKPRLNRKMHDHTVSGSHGVSFAYVLGEDGRVSVLAYGYAFRRDRDSNDYRWNGSGRAVSGALTLAVIAGHDALTRSVELLAGIGSASARRLRARAGAGGPRDLPDRAAGAGVSAGAGFGVAPFGGALGAIDRLDPAAPRTSRTGAGRPGELPGRAASPAVPGSRGGVAVGGVEAASVALDMSRVEPRSRLNDEPVQQMLDFELGDLLDGVYPDGGAAEWMVATAGRLTGSDPVAESAAREEVAESGLVIASEIDRSMRSRNRPQHVNLGDVPASLGMMLVQKVVDTLQLLIVLHLQGETVNICWDEDPVVLPTVADRPHRM